MIDGVEVDPMLILDESGEPVRAHAWIGQKIHCCGYAAESCELQDSSFHTVFAHVQPGGRWTVADVLDQRSADNITRLLENALSIEQKLLQEQRLANVGFTPVTERAEYIRQYAVKPLSIVPMTARDDAPCRSQELIEQEQENLETQWWRLHDGIPHGFEAFIADRNQAMALQALSNICADLLENIGRLHQPYGRSATEMQRHADHLVSQLSGMDLNFDRIPSYSGDLDGWFEEMADRDLLFHPDDSPFEVGHGSHGRWVPIFSRSEAVQVAGILERIFHDAADDPDRVYSAAYERSIRALHP